MLQVLLTRRATIIRTSTCTPFPFLIFRNNGAHRPAVSLGCSNSSSSFLPKKEQPLGTKSATATTVPFRKFHSSDLSSHSKSSQDMTNDDNDENDKDSKRKSQQEQSSASSAAVAVAQMQSTNNKLTNLHQVALCAHYAITTTTTTKTTAKDEKKTYDNNSINNNDTTDNNSNNVVMLCLPECFGFIGSSVQETLDNAEAEDDIYNGDDNGDTDDGTTGTKRGTNPSYVSKQLIDIVRYGNVNTPNNDDIMTMANEKIHLMDGLRTIAKESQLWISAGGMHVLVPSSSSSTTSTENGVDDDDDSQHHHRRRRRVTNSHFILNQHGIIQARYDKIHLFDVTIPEQNIYLQESKTTKSGNGQVVICNSPIGRLGLSTCYDVRFPELYTALAEGDNENNISGADVILVPSAFTVPTGQAHWHILLQARAIETQCYVLAAAQYGKHNAKRQSFGHAIAINPWGKIIADAGGYGNNTIDDNVTTSATTTSSTTTSSSNGTSSSSTGTSTGIITTPSIITCPIDIQNILQPIRQKMPISQHRKNAGKLKIT